MKSGTTFLQNAFSNSRVKLKENGVLYPGNQYNQQHACYGICGDFIPWVSPCQRWTAMGKSMLQEIKDHNGDILITSEALASMNMVGIELFCEQLEGVDKVVITVRNFTKTLLSAWQQSVKGGGKNGLIEFFERLDRDYQEQKGLWRTYSFGRIAEKWSKHANVHLIVVEEESTSVCDSVLETFSEIIGVSLPAPPNLSESERNVSLHFEDVETLRHINMLFETTPKQERVRMIRKLLNNHFFPATSISSGLPIRITTSYAKKTEKWAEKEIEILPSDIRVHGNLENLKRSKSVLEGELKNMNRDECFRRLVEIVGNRDN